MRQQEGKGKRGEPAAGRFTYESRICGVFLIRTFYYPSRILEILTQGMPWKVVLQVDPAHVWVMSKADAEHVVDLTFMPFRPNIEIRDGFYLSTILVFFHLTAKENFMTAFNREEMHHNVKIFFPVHTGKLKQHLKSKLFFILQVLHNLSVQLFWDNQIKVIVRAQLSYLFRGRIRVIMDCDFRELLLEGLEQRPITDALCRWFSSGRGGQLFLFQANRPGGL